MIRSGFWPFLPRERFSEVSSEVAATKTWLKPLLINELLLGRYGVLKIDSPDCPVSASALRSLKERSPSRVDPAR